MNQTVAIISLVIIAVIVAGVVVGAYWFFGKIQENNYCENWYNSIEDRRITLENKIVEYNNAGFWEQMQTDPDYLNSKAAALDQEGNQYNRECAY